MRYQDVIINEIIYYIKTLEQKSFILYSTDAGSFKDNEENITKEARIKKISPIDLS